MNVVHTEKDGNTYANIQGAAPLPKGMTAPELSNPKRSLDINSIPYHEMDELPEFIRNKMKSSEEYAARLRVDNDPAVGAAMVKNFRPKAVGGEPVIEYPAAEDKSGRRAVLNVAAEKRRPLRGGVFAIHAHSGQFR